MAFPRYGSLIKAICRYLGRPGSRANLLGRRAGFLYFLLLLSTPGASAETDRLSLPASLSRLADSSLLLDITAVKNRLYAVGERGHILYSEDQGDSWQQARVPVSVTLTAVDFIDASHGWAVGHDGVILNSQDGGRSWQKQLDGFRVNQMVVDHYRKLLEAAEQQLQSLTKQGEELAELEERVETYEFDLEDAEIALEEGPAKPFLDLLFVSRQQGWAIGSYGLIFETRDGGQHWISRLEQLDNPDGFHLNAIMQSRRGTLYIAGEAGILFRSDDLGQSWQRLDSPYDGSFYAIAEIQPSGDLLVTGLRGRGYRSEDQGESWIELEMATRSTLTSLVQLDSGELIAAGSSGSLSISSDGGRQFRAQIQPGRRGYSGLVATASGSLILVGQGGISTLDNQQLQEVLR